MTRRGGFVRELGITNQEEKRERSFIKTFAGSMLLLVLFATTSRAQTYTLLHSFSGSDGKDPAYGALVIDAAGNLYGATEFGGTTVGCTGLGCGVVFKMDANGNETVLHAFAWESTETGDGWGPIGQLIRDSSGNLYGATAYGGPDNAGTIFQINGAGSESILYDFHFTYYGLDGNNPASLLRDSSGNFYGVTVNGGVSFPDFQGTVFKLYSSGNETVFHNFMGSDGSTPYGALIMDSQGNLYGTTSSGGLLGSCYGGYGCGTIFKLDSAGNETVLHEFSGADGEYPFGGLLRDSAGNLYGTTSYGGLLEACYGGVGCGTIYKLDASGNFSVLYAFTGQSDGANPFGALIQDNAGNLYGTASAGGDLAPCYAGCGVVFKLSSSGTETVLHTFTSSDGAGPLSTLLMDSALNIYGTTLGGGASNDGTVFKIAMGTPFSAIATKLAISGGASPGFALKAQLTQGSGAPAIDPLTQEMTLKVGTYVASIPVGSFRENKKGAYVYSGTINGVALQIRILQTAATSYQVQVTASGVNLTTLSRPIPVTITLGYNTGTTAI